MTPNRLAQTERGLLAIAALISAALALSSPSWPLTLVLWPLCAAFTALAILTD